MIVEYMFNECIHGGVCCPPIWCGLTDLCILALTIASFIIILRTVWDKIGGIKNVVSNSKKS